MLFTACAFVECARFFNSIRFVRPELVSFAVVNKKTTVRYMKQGRRFFADNHGGWTDRVLFPNQPVM